MLLFTISCSDKTTSNQDIDQETGLIPISISLAPLQELDVTITTAIATVSKDNDEITQTLDVADNIAEGTIDDLNPGVWHLEVELFSDEYQVAFGETDVEVFPGQTSLVNLTMTVNDITGSIEIIVDWEFTDPLPERILFIGNSYTYSNGGLEEIFKSVTESTDANLQIEVEAITGGGMTLQNHFENETTQATILRGDWDLVILQEQSQLPILDTPTFLTYATKLDSLIDLSGAQSCFFMTWAREYDQSQIAGLSSAYLEAGQLLDAIVVPAGQLFNYVHEDNQNINLYVSDGSHPSMLGSYLASLCFYQSIFDGNAQDVMFIPTGVTSSDADYLKTSVNQWYLNNR
jgi:hypothetical protein